VRVSVIIPCRNAVRTVADAVRSALEQSEPPLEVLAVDDASTDRTSLIARTAGARVLSTGHRRYAGGARNIGIDASCGDVLAFLDADVVASRNWLERVRVNFESDPEIVGVGGRIENGRPGRYGDLDLYLNHSEWLSRRPGAKGLIPTLGIAYRSSAVGPVRFVETNVGEDASFGVEVRARGGKFWYDPQIRMNHRHERLTSRAFWEKQIACGRTLYRTRVLHDRPGRILVRFPALLFTFPHLWIVLVRMVRAGSAWKALTLFPWLVAGEMARIRGFLQARREHLNGGGLERPREVRA